MKSSEAPKINRLNDRFVKYIFGTERNKMLLMDFINDALCLEGEKIIDEITLNVGELIQGAHDRKSSRLDVSAKLADGTTIDVEVQIVNYHDFEKRFPFYWAMRHVIKSSSGMDYIEIKPTILICVLDFDLLDEEDFHNTYSIRNDKTNSRLCDDMQLIFLELPKFKKAKNKPATGLERWLVYFSTEEGKKMGQLAEIARVDPMIGRAMQLEREFWANQHERELYFAEEKRIRDEVSAQRNYDTLIRIKSAEAEAKGEARGKAEGKAEAARNLFKAKVDIGVISQATGFSPEEIRKFAAQ